MESMRAVVYPPPRDGLPHVAVIFHTDGTIALSKAFINADDAHRYIMGLSSSLVKVDSPRIA